MGMLDTNVAIFGQFDTTETYILIQLYIYIFFFSRAPVCGRLFPCFCMEFLSVSNGAVAEKFPTNHSSCGFCFP